GWRGIASMVATSYPTVETPMTQSNPFNRRALLKLISGAALASVPAVGLVSRASAARRWCLTDPVFAVDEFIGNVLVMGELDKSYDVTGPTRLTFIVPYGTDARLLSSDSSFGQGYDISVLHDSKLQERDDRIEIKIRVFVPARSNNLRVRVEFVPD